MLFGDRIWLPGNFLWSDFDEDDTPSLVFVVPLAVVIVAVRFCVEKFCFVPIGRYLLVRRNRKNKVRAYPKQKEAGIRARKHKSTILKKFCESGWRFTYYSLIFGFGCLTLWDKAWLWDIDECWRRFPFEPRTLDIYWYYSISLSFYCALFVTQFFDVKRKDFWQMFVHHVATISLLTMSWCCRAHTIGTLILLLHDFSDIFLEAYKITKYSGFNKIAFACFVILSISWIVTRVFIFPIWIIKSAVFDYLEHHEPYPGWAIMNGFLILLYLLHIMWAYFIVKLFYRMAKSREVVDDIRSESEDSD
ncbi:hypothetical protein FQR65_LT17719 [Abscondita terminalis]|nr:hypothetical protein FQR65_LT17719 [Abscondita terminalis]